jgi:hypothetical protein
LASVLYAKPATCCVQLFRLPLKPSLKTTVAEGGVGGVVTFTAVHQAE